MINEFKAKFGDKWNDDWFVQEVCDYCDEFVNTPGDNKYLARFFDYKLFIDSICEKNEHSIWAVTVKKDVKALRQILYYHCRPYATKCCDENGDVKYICEADKLYLITNADLNLLDNNSGKIVYVD
jgi:hypothetical protein